MQQITITQKYIGAENISSVNSRDLYQLLGIKKDFSSWIKSQINTLELEQNFDYIKLTQKGELSKTGQILTNYHITIDTAKHIAMASRTIKGKEVRKYFIEIEKSHKNQTYIDRGGFTDHLLKEKRELQDKYYKNLEFTNKTFG